MDVDRVGILLRLKKSILLQWSHVLMDVDSFRWFDTGDLQDRFNGATS